MSAVARKRKIGGTLYDYLVSRGSSIAFAGVLAMGLALGSLFCISSADGAELLRSIVANQLTLQATQNLLQLIIGGVSGFAGIFIFIYICLNSRKGSLLIYAVPLIHGLSLGSIITSILVSHGYSAVSYVLLCIFVPNSVKTLLLLSVCNKTSRYCKEQYQSATSRKGRGSFPILLYVVLFAIYFVLEALFVLAFRSLL